MLRSLRQARLRRLGLREIKDRKEQPEYESWKKEIRMHPSIHPVLASCHHQLALLPQYRNSWSLYSEFSAMEGQNTLACVSQIAPGSLLRTYPELLSSIAGPPSDSQAAVLRSEIERAKREISTASLHIGHFQDALTRLRRHREEIETFVRTHSGILSTLRHFPNEILLEIFQQTVTESAAVDRVPWVLSGVCSHWRRVTLAAPSLWTRFPPLSVKGDHPFSTPMMSLQLERAQHTPLSIDFGKSISPHALALLLPVISQWEDVTINVSSLMLPQLSGHTFSALKKLTLCSFSRAPTSALDINRIDSLPSLVHLTLNTAGDSYFPRHLLLPWTQLRICELYDASSYDILWILPQLNGGTLVTIIGSIMVAFEPNPTTSLVRSLTFTDCTPAFLVDVLSNLSMPALDTLIVQISGPTYPLYPFTGAILALLERSACALQRLCIDTHLNEDDLARLLESPHLQNVTDLEFPRAPLSSRSIAALGALPNLRMLVVCGTSADEAALLAALTANRPRVISHSAHSGAAAGELRLSFTPG
ncbi:hypothetical protein C8R46DRAFT_1191968 [Mycena filopes]|nr:hypothetical protein C8R46DRAFT_1191968 [Mycena filopes]